MMIKRRQNLRFLLTVGAVALLVFFFMLFLQSSQIDDSMAGQLAARRNRQNQRVNELGENVQQASNLNPSLGEFKTNAKQTIVRMDKLVHLDLKGSPPKLNYLKELIPYLKKVGATGLLVEYEDFFPYEGDLESVKNQNHYTKSELDQLFDLIKANELKLIPLVQTYGHLEYVLKLKQYAYLREAKEHFNVITPCLNDTYEKVVFRMMDQILEMHPETLEYIHIGCDEVYFVNRHPDCSITKMRSVQDFFINHVSKVIDYIKTKRPRLNVMIWDDMIRNNMISNGVNTQLLQFAKKVVPVVWNYRERVEVSENAFNTYNEIFKEIWFASAFKGATHQLEIVPNARLHYSNHLSWLDVIKKFPDPLKIKGMILTGWSRYDHMQAVVETLPAGIPSLVLCLQTIKNFDQMSEYVFARTKDLTKCNYEKTLTGFIMDPTSSSNSVVRNIDLSRTESPYTCDFPGANVYTWLVALRLHLTKYRAIERDYADILNNYNLKNGFFNTMVYYEANGAYRFYKSRIESFKLSGEVLFDKYFYTDLYVEFTEVYIKTTLDQIDQRLLLLNQTKVPEYAAVRPFEKIAQNLI